MSASTHNPGPRLCATCSGTLSEQGLCARCLLSRDLPALPLGDHLLLGEELGRGGMGTVFRAEDTRLHRTVAVKLLREELAHDAASRARLQREARALAQLSHPNIVQIFEVGDDAGQPFLVMELIEGEPLSQQLPLTPSRAAAIGAQICDALAHAHSKSIIHRDVKPENVLIDAEGNAHLADFGIARALQPDARMPALTAPSLQAGTPNYLAPELLDGAPADARSDLYSAGVLVYRAVTGSFPRGDFEPLPGALDAIVRRALARDPARRYTNAAEMRDALATFAGSASESSTSSRTIAPIARDLSGRGSAVPIDEEMFLIRGAALLCAASAGVSIWAALQSATPRVVSPGELLPLVSLVTQTLSDGRVVSYARFETGPFLFAAAALSVAFGCLALLRKHWRAAHLDVPRPMEPIAESRTVFVIGLLCCSSYFLRRLAEQRGILGPAIYAPLLGGMLELYALYLFFIAMLHAWRTARPLRREPALFIGFALALTPPAFDFLSFLSRWKP